MNLMKSYLKTCLHRGNNTLYDPDLEIDLAA